MFPKPLGSWSSPLRPTSRIGVVLRPVSPQAGARRPFCLCSCREKFLPMAPEHFAEARLQPKNSCSTCLPGVLRGDAGHTARHSGANSQSNEGRAAKLVGGVHAGIDVTALWPRLRGYP